MKTTNLLLVLLLQVTLSLAQNVGINNPNPAASALLDLTSTNKGLLVPRMTTAQRLAIATPATGLMVYDNTLSQFFYFDGIVWRAISSGSTGWGLTGNAGTVEPTNFIGSTDDAPFNIRINNQRAGRIERTRANVSLGYQAGNLLGTGVLSPTSNVFIGDQAGAANGSSTSHNNTFVGARAGLVSNTIGNSFFGAASGVSNTSGSSNSFFGHVSGDSNVDGSFNSFFGSNTGAGNISGIRNSFFGGLSGINSTGNFNSFFGYNSGSANIIGIRNTIIGYDADVNTSSLSNATAIGAEARVDASNAMVLGSIAGVNGATSNVNVGIGTTNPLQRLEVKGLNVPAAISGIGQNGIARFQPDGTSLTMDMGGSGASPAHSWIQVRDNVSYATNYNLSLNPNGGNVGIGTVNPATTLDVDGSIAIQNNNNLSWGGAFGPGIPTIASTINDGIYFYPTGSTSGITMKISSSLVNVTGSIRMVDGNQGAGKIMVSDANGTASWQSPSAATNAWGLTGNAGTVAGTNFIGTTDNAPLNFRVSNITAGKIDGSNAFIGIRAGLINTGIDNAFFGTNTGMNNVDGINNSFFGRQSGFSNSSGHSNSFFGSSAGQGNTLGGSNTFIGFVAGFINTIGSNNTIIGERADLNANNLNNASAFGSRARVDASNSIVLGSVAGINGATSSVNVGIGTTSPVSTLDVNGSAGSAIRTVSAATTLSVSDHTLILLPASAGATITLPFASTSNRREYVIVNQSSTAFATSNAYKNFSGISSTVIPANSSITIQSDGSSWHRTR